MKGQIDTMKILYFVKGQALEINRNIWDTGFFRKKRIFCNFHFMTSIML